MCFGNNPSETQKEYSEIELSLVQDTKKAARVCSKLQLPHVHSAPIGAEPQ